MREDMDSLREKALKATPGPWSCCGDHCKCTAVLCGDHPIAEVVKGGWGDEYPSLRFKEGGAGQLSATSVEAYMEKIVYGEIPVEQAMYNRAYIAACDPQTILALLDDNERLRKALEPFVAWLDALDIEFADHSDDTIVGGFGIATVTFGQLRAARLAHEDAER